MEDPARTGPDTSWQCFDSRQKQSSRSLTCSEAMEQNDARIGAAHIGALDSSAWVVYMWRQSVVTLPAPQRVRDAKNFPSALAWLHRRLMQLKREQWARPLDVPQDRRARRRLSRV